MILWWFLAKHFVIDVLPVGTKQDQRRNLHEREEPPDGVPTVASMYTFQKKFFIQQLHKQDALISSPEMSPVLPAHVDRMRIGRSAIVFLAICHHGQHSIFGYWPSWSAWSCDHVVFMLCWHNVIVW